MITRRVFASAGLAAASPHSSRGDMFEPPMGPLWTVHPDGGRPSLNAGVVHGRSLWQSARLEVR